MTHVLNLVMFFDKCEWINEDAKECLKFINSLPESKIIMWDSLHLEELLLIKNFLKEEGINIYEINSNRDINSNENCCFNQKFYFSILLDIGAGFNPDTDWKIIMQTIKKVKKDMQRLLTT